MLARTTASNGSITGRVIDQQSLRAVPGASVVLGLPGGGCPNGFCPTNITDALGDFTIAAPAGNYTMMVSADNYTGNETPVQVRSGIRSAVGTVFLVEDSFVAGTLVGSDPTHEPVPNVTVTGSSRNGALSGGGSESGPNGTFLTEVPPGADEIDFTTPGDPYLSNFTFADPAPGRTVNLGVIYLVRATEIHFNIVDRVTGLPIGPLFPSRTQVCEAQTSNCPLPGIISKGSAITAYAVPGPTQVQEIVLGYVVNVSMIGTIPTEPAGVAITRQVNVTPLGVLRFTPGVTGGPPTAGGNSTPYSEFWLVSPNSNFTGLDLCSLDNVEVGVVAPPPEYYAPSPCWPGILTHFGGSMLALGPPLRDWMQLGSFEGAAPMIENETWVNLTPDRVTQVGYLNFTPGAYVAGQVLITGTTQSPPSFVVQACSTDATEICGPMSGFPYPGSPGSIDIDSANATRVGCPTGPSFFCVAAPPGPDQLFVRASSNYTTNTTWVEVPPLCCVANPHALALSQVTTDHVTSINLTPIEGIVTGKVIAAHGTFGPALGLVTIDICPAASDGGSCLQWSTANASFAFPGDLGWDEVTFQAVGFEKNYSWVDVTGTTPVGTIELTPFAGIAGKVVDPNGSGIAGAVLQYCPVAQATPPASECLPLNTGSVGSSGYFVATIPGGPYPGSTYQISASASGFLTNFTWVNASSGALVTLAPIVLTPVGNGSMAPAAIAAPRPGGNPGTWVDGRIVEAPGGAGVPGVQLSACTFTGSLCIAFTDQTGSGGQFNESLPLGRYRMAASVGGYASGVFYVNATSTAPLHLGALALVPFPWVSGRVAIGPWINFSRTSGFGPGEATAQVCNSNRSECGISTSIDTAGAFNLTAPPGFNDGLDINGTGGQPVDWATAQYAQGSGSGGFLGNLTPVAVNASGTSLSQAPARIPELAIFAAVQGEVWDGSSGRNSGGAPLRSAPWTILTTAGPGFGDSTQLYTSGDGSYTVFLAGPAKVRLVATGSAFLGANASVSVPAAGALVAAAPGLDLPHYGWVVGRVTSAAGGTVPSASVTVSESDPANSTVLYVSTTSDGWGYFNVSAPPGSSVRVNVSADGYLSGYANVSVSPSRTFPVALKPLTPTYTTEYVRSRYVNDAAVPPTATLVDPVPPAPIYAAALEVLDGNGNLEDGSSSNGIGQFFIPTVAGSAATLSITAAVFATINVTGDGVLAGRVVSAPDAHPTWGVNVTGCEVYPNGGCETVTSNGAGIFWLEVPPGDYLLNLSAVGFTPESTYGAVAASDGFSWIGNVTVDPDAVVEGRVVGGPFDIPLVGANVSLCPSNGSFSVYCAFNTPTDPTGGFAVPSPPGDYYVNVSAAGYGRWSLLIQLSPGESFDLGTVELSPDGSVAGRVVDGTNDSPIRGALVSACPSDGGPCAGPVGTNSTGWYELGPLDPGVAEEEVTANGYAAGYGPVTVPVGGIGIVPTVALLPVGTVPEYDVEGTVEWAANQAGISGATVTAAPLGGSGSGAATVSGSNGTFTLLLEAGHYRVTARWPGAEVSGIDVSVTNASIAGLTLELNRTMYRVDGTVLGPGSVAGLPGVWVTVEGTGVANETGTGGRFALELPNGTYEISAAPPEGSLLAAEFSPVREGLSVDGSGAVVNLTLPELEVAEEIVAVDSETGLGVAGAVGTVRGTTSLGAPETVAVTTDGGGTVGLALPAGSYRVSLNASGYGVGSAAFTVNATGATVIVSMAPVGGASAGGSGGLSGAEVEWAIAAAIGVAAVGILGLGRRRGRRAEPPEPTGPGVEAPGEPSLPPE
jgi:hypothetical protein